MVWVRTRDSGFLKELTTRTVFNPSGVVRSLLYLFLWSNSLLLFLRLESLLRFWADFLIKTDSNSQCREVQWAGKKASLSPRIPSHLQSVLHKQSAHLFFSLLDLLSSARQAFPSPFLQAKCPPTLHRAQSLDRPRTGHGATLPDLCGLGTLRRGGMPATR